MALEEGVSHLFFIDSDMDIPHDAYPRLMECDADVACGLMWTKHIPSFPTTFRDGKPYLGAGIEEIDECGMACTMIRTDFLKRMPKPWFYMDGSGGEDHVFCREAKRHGATIKCNYEVKTGHLGFIYYTGQGFSRNPANQRPDRIGNRAALEQYGVLQPEGAK